MYFFNFFYYVFYRYIYVFLFLCMFCSVYFFIVPIGTLQLPWLRFLHLYFSVVRQMPEYNSQRKCTARNFPKLIALYIFFCKCVLYYCHCVSTQLQLTNISTYSPTPLNSNLTTPVFLSTLSFNSCQIKPRKRSKKWISTRKLKFNVENMPRKFR